MHACLISLRIRNLALVEELEWLLAPGFTAVTGETGSGKSIIVGALKLILGERADKALVRTGADQCTVEAVFSVQDPAALDARLAEEGLEPCEDAQLLIKRTFSTSGTNRQFINGGATTLAVLKQLGDGLIDLHGPHEHQSLLAVEKQMELLDAFAGANETFTEYTKAYRRLAALRTEHEELASSEAALERELDLLRHQVGEIGAAELVPGEEEELNARFQVAANSKRLLELANRVVSCLSESDDAVLTRLGQAGKLLRDLERIDPTIARHGEAHLRAVAELEEVAASMQSYADHLELDPERMAEMEDRIGVLETLKRKYGGSVEAVIAFGATAAARLQKIESRGEEIERLAREIVAGEKALVKIGAALSAQRGKAVTRLAKEVTEHLRDLGFKRADFSVQLVPLAQPTVGGLERVEFLFAPNPGEPPKPLKAIASSGEISRVMLAVKSALAAQDTVPLLVFDEIDANVGGEIARAVGEKMLSLGARHQILSISHFPQVAALADAQFVVSKEFQNERTVSRLTAVSGDARVQELARMLGGQGESALAHARTLLGGR